MNRTLLLGIDVQEGQFEGSKPIYQAEETLSRMTNLIARAHAAQILVVYVQDDDIGGPGSAVWEVFPLVVLKEGGLRIRKLADAFFQGLRTLMNLVPGQLEVAYGLLEGHEHLLPSPQAFLEGQARRWEAKELIARVREDWPEQAFYAGQGFGEHDRSWASTLDLARFDPAPLQGVQP